MPTKNVVIVIIVCQIANVIDKTKKVWGPRARPGWAGMERASFKVQFNFRSPASFVLAV